MLSVFALNTGSPQSPKRLAKVLPVSKLSSLCPTIVRWQVETPGKPKIGQSNNKNNNNSSLFKPCIYGNCCTNNYEKCLP